MACNVENGQEMGNSSFRCVCQEVIVVVQGACDKGPDWMVAVELEKVVMGQIWGMREGRSLPVPWALTSLSVPWAPAPRKDIPIALSTWPILASVSPSVKINMVGLSGSWGLFSIFCSGIICSQYLSPFSIILKSRLSAWPDTQWGRTAGGRSLSSPGLTNSEQ